MGPLGEATLLGILQGLTEFLPVSSSGHLSLAALVFQMGTGGLGLYVMLHGGTFLATLIVLWERITPVVKEGVAGLFQPRRFTSTNAGRDALAVLIATLPTGVVGILLRGPVERFTASPTALGLGFLATTLLLVSTRWIKFGEAPSLSGWGALLVGIAQGLAVFPGVSRSGATIAAALWLGVRKDRAFELSMLVSLPAVLGAVALELPRVVPETLLLGPAAVGAAVAFACGVAALVVLKKAVIQGRFAWFALWVGPLALATLAMAKAWPAR